MRKAFNNIQELREVFLTERYILLDMEYKGNKTPMKMLCPNGHYINKTLSEWKRGSRCKYCAKEGTIIKGLKKCSICEEWKSIKKYYPRKDRKGGYRPQCMECSSDIGIKKYSNNIDYFKAHNKTSYHQPLGFNENNRVRKEIKIYEEIRKSEKGNVEVKCAGCEKWFEPKRGILKHRIHAGNGEITSGSEIRLYCSDKCKENCPVYGQRNYRKDNKPISGRDVQNELRKIVLERDGYACVKCGSQENLICHHIEGIHWEPIESADIDICITICKDCHGGVHNQPGCKFQEMRCH